MTRKTFSMRTLAGAFALALVAAGCSGSDGSQGPAGPQGATGPTGPQGPTGTVAVATTEACRGCHGQFASNHALPDYDGVHVTMDPTWPVSVVGNNITLKFNVKVNGVNRDDFIYKAAYTTAGGTHVEDIWWVYDVTSTAGMRMKFQPTTWAHTATGNGTGNYVVTIDATQIGTVAVGGGTTTHNPTDNGTGFMVSIKNSGGAVATAVAFVGGQTHDVVSDQACMNCHGDHVWRELTGGSDHVVVARPQGVNACLFCHNRVGAGDPRMTGAGVGLMSFIHGIHNSKHWPEGGYRPYWSPNYLATVSIGFPAYMNNCATCHDSPARLAQVKDDAFSWDLCSSCHGTAKIGHAPNSHATFSKTTQACTTCHPGATVADAHNGLKTERAGLIWDGADQSVVWGKRVKMDIASVGYDAGAVTTLVVTWTASWDADGDGVFTAVDPCNTNFALGPVFLSTTANARDGRADENMSLLRAYAQANDWVNGLAAVTSPGQPASTNLRKVGGNGLTGTANTTCAGNVATTKVAADTTTATRAAVALQGKPQIRFDPAVGTSTEIIQVRAQSPVREFVPGTGALPATTRRQIISMDKCNKCHLGSMYQHGGNRVDAIELCVMCHNPASTEQQNRVAYGVTAEEAYDGKVGQTYDMRTMVHAIHAAGETGNLLMYYRSNGVYAFGSEGAIAAIPNWKTTPSISCTGLDSHGAFAAQTAYMVYGSVATGSVNVATASGPGSALSLDPTGACSSLATNRLPAPFTQGTYRTLNEIVVHYPQALNKCTACHINDSEKSLPDPNKAVAVTVDMGASVSSLTDDVLKGPTAATCMSCHMYGSATTKYFLDKHSYDNGWWPAAFPNGRQTLIDAAP